MFNRAYRSPPPSPVKPPERCPHCGSPKIATKGCRLKKLETIRLYHCRSCDRRFTPGPRGLRNKTYPVGEILEALTDYNRGHSLEEVSRRHSSRYGHAVSPATISRWLSAHPGLTTYRRLREEGRRLFAPSQLIRIIKLYHAQVYEFGYHRAKLAFLREGTLDDRRPGDTRFAPLADFLETFPAPAPTISSGAMTAHAPPNYRAVSSTLTANRDRHPRLQRFMLAN